MVRTVGAIDLHALPGKGRHHRIDVAKTVRSAARGVARLLHRDSHIESFIRQRGGVMSDEVERELVKRYGAM
ncbi:hypothetical protein KKP04_07815 [Rhodomicrobium sp. Az07]|uniref:hypothetical protein n=1 Tax=Rhodomicrobium sp. Az07 TaxID=2839034 RepID=UPI001BE8BA3C|nr:hypothetical protein [Rhodomicrobium sp. Az07]MBT3070770.1 hypothetical protein [Rhodomicrobium sp. Az07]